MWSRLIKFSVSVILPLVFLYWFFRGIDRGKLADSLENVGAGWWLLILAAGIQVVHCLLRAARWRILLGPLKKDVGYYNLISTISIGYMVTMLGPLRLGEVLRPVLLAGRENISKGGAIATILLERLMDALTVASLFAIYLIFFLGPEGGMGREAAAGMSVGWGVLMGSFIVLSFPLLYAVVHFRARVAGLLERVVKEESRAGKAIHAVFHAVVDGFEVIKGGRALLAAWSYSFLIWLTIAFSIWFSVRAFGIHIPLQGSLLMLGALTLGIAIPTPGGVGGYDLLGQQALIRFFGVDPSTAAAAILVMHAFAIGPVIIMGFAFLWKDGLSFSGVTARAKAGADGTAANCEPAGVAAKTEPAPAGIGASPAAPARRATGADR